MHIQQRNRGQLPAAAEWNSLATAYNAGAFGNDNPERGRQLQGVRGKNISGSDRERFEVMTLGDPVTTLTTDGQVDLVFDLDDATADGTPAILLEPIADGLMGRVLIDGLALALVATASATTDRWGTPNGTNHNLDAGDEPTGLKLLGPPSTSGTSLCPVLLGAAGSGIIDLRLSGNDLQYTFDGSTWITWHTGGPCAE